MGISSSASSDHLGAESFCGVPKLQNVRSEGNWIHATLPASTDGEKWWNPAAEYFKHPQRPPYKALLSSWSDRQDIVHFLQNFGPITRNHGDGVKAVYQLSEFRAKAAEFNFAALVAAKLRNPAKLRAYFRTMEQSASLGNVKSPTAVRNIRYRVGYSLGVPLDSSGEGLALDSLRQRLAVASDSELVKAAQKYLTLAINQQKLGALFDFGANGSARLYVFLGSHDLLASFYWMLAHSLASQTDLESAAPIECKSCGAVFFAQKRNQVYCRKQRCKEQGRKRLGWNRNKAKYNRERRQKRD